MRANRRAVAVAALLPLALLLLGGGLLFATTAWWSWLAGTVLVVFGLLVLLSLGVVWCTALITLEEDALLVRLNWATAERVPVEYVECFFLGEGQTELPGSAGRTAKTRTVVVRLAEAARQYHHRPVPSWLGRWSGGYITINGAWCEPITCELLQAFNDRLRQLQADRARVGSGSSVASPANAQAMNR